MKKSDKITESLKEKKDITSIIKLSVVAALSSLGIVISTFVVFVPNVEFISFTIFLISCIFGFYYGSIAMLTVSITYELIVSPIYGSSGALFIFKIISYLLLVIVGSAIRKFSFEIKWWEYGVIGGVFALVYDIVTTIGGQWLILQSKLTIIYLISVIIIGVPFTIVHVIGNFIIFSSMDRVISLLYSVFRYRSVKLLPDLENNLSIIKSENA